VDADRSSRSHLFHFRQRTRGSNRGGAGFKPSHVAVGMVAMMMRVDHVTNGRLGRGLDLGQHDLHATWEIAVHHQHKILENNPTLIAVALVQIALM